MKNKLLKVLQETKKRMKETVIDFKDEDYIFIFPIDIGKIPAEFLEENVIATTKPDGILVVTIYGIEYAFDVYANNILLMNKEEYKKYGLTGIKERSKDENRR